MSVAISIAALMISLLSFTFTVYQSRLLGRIRRQDKIASLIRHAAEIRRKSKDLQNKANSTDNSPNCDSMIERADAMLRVGVESLVDRATTTLAELYRMERSLVALEVEIDLLYKHVCDVERLNLELRSHERDSANNSL